LRAAAGGEAICCQWGFPFIAVGFSQRIAMKKKQGFSQTTYTFWLKPDSVCYIIPSAEADGNETGQKPRRACLWKLLAVMDLLSGMFGKVQSRPAGRLYKFLSYRIETSGQTSLLYFLDVNCTAVRLSGSVRRS